MTRLNAAAAGYPHLSPNMPVGILQTEKKGQAHRRIGAMQLVCRKEATDPSARTRAQVSKQTTEIRGQEKRGKPAKRHML